MHVLPLLFSLACQVEPTPLPSEPVVEVPMLESTVTAEPPRPMTSWDQLQVPQSTWQAVWPDGPVDHVLDAGERAQFWQRFTTLRRESLVLDAVQLGILVIPPAVALVGAVVVVCLGLPAASVLLGQGSSLPPAERLVGAPFSLAPTAGLVAIAAGGLVGVVFAGLAAWDSRDTGGVPMPAHPSKDARRADAKAQRGTWTHVTVALVALGAAWAVALPALVMPWLLPFLLAPLAGTTPQAVGDAWSAGLGRADPLLIWGAVGGYTIMVAITALVPTLGAVTYLAQVLPGALGAEDDPDVTDAHLGGSALDVSDYNPFAAFFGR